MSITIPEISFLIPAKNASSFLKNTLASITKFLETNQNFKKPTKSQVDFIMKLAQNKLESNAS